MAGGVRQKTRFLVPAQDANVAGGAARRPHADRGTRLEVGGDRRVEEAAQQLQLAAHRAGRETPARNPV